MFINTDTNTLIAIVFTDFCYEFAINTNCQYN